MYFKEMKKLLKPLSCAGQVILGEKIGRTINFPTANLSLNKPLNIKPGVYLAVCRLNKNSYLGLAYYGPRYIFHKLANSFEIYLFDFNQAIYGEQISVKLTHWLRPPQRINSLKKLQKLLQADLTALNDFVILVNHRDQPLGIQKKVQAHLGSAQLHRAISVQILNSKKELLLQQRSKHKMLFPLLWANTVCTDVRPYESYLMAAQRRLQEELNLHVVLQPLAKFYYQAGYAPVGSEKEIDQLFIGFSDQKPRLDHHEVNQCRYLNLKNLQKAMRQQPGNYTPWFKLILKKLLSSVIFNP